MLSPDNIKICINTWPWCSKGFTSPQQRRQFSALGLQHGAITHASINNYLLANLDEEFYAPYAAQVSRIQETNNQEAKHKNRYIAIGSSQIWCTLYYINVCWTLGTVICDPQVSQALLYFESSVPLSPTPNLSHSPLPWPSHNIKFTNQL